MAAGRLEVVVFVGGKGVSWRGLHPRVDDTPVGISNWLHLPRVRHQQLPDHPQRRHPSTCTGTGTGSDGSQIRFTSRGHFVLDKCTGEVRRNTNIITCRVS